ncbi:MAG TPA: hypothetical protein VF680_17460 [Allosphingosinicella sp.]|jgi:phage terminase small subunit
MMAAFAAGKVAGLTNRDAGLHAGYSEKCVEQTATKLMKHPGVKAAIKAGTPRVRKPKGGKDDWDGDGAGESAKVDALEMPKAKYTCAKEFLTDAMNHPRLPIAARADYAKALLPYQHGKVGDVGKKENAKTRAEKIAGNGGNGKPSKFQTKEAPQLRVVR